MADGRHPENLLYREKGSTDLRKIWYDDAHLASQPDRKLKFATFENPRWRTAAILKKSKIGHISGMECILGLRSGSEVKISNF